MKVFFYFGRNPHNKSGISAKIWKIERSGTTVSVWWGRAQVIDRRPVDVSGFATKTWPRFRSVKAAREAEAKRIEAKLRHGYQRMPRRGSSRPYAPGTPAATLP
jgi:predicted DNA-binding WGR domain protein